MIINNINELKHFSEDLAKKTKPFTTYALIGDLAAGKTTFTKFFINFFLNNENVISPTFNIVKSYKIDKNDIDYINHFDVYRINNNEELLEIGFYDFIIDKKSVNIIEWADLIKDELPKNTIYIFFKKFIDDENKREITIYE